MKKIAENPTRDRTTRLFFVRHGESKSRTEGSIADRTLDVGLTPKGVNQCQELGQFLARYFSESFTFIYSSQMKRTLRTSEVVSQQWGDAQLSSLPLKKEERLHERYYGNLEGASAREYATYKEKEARELLALNSFEERFSYKVVPEAESLKEIHQRVASFIQEVSKEHIGENLLVSAHAGVMKALLIADAAYRKGYEVFYRSFDLKNASGIAMESTENQFSLKAAHRVEFKK